MIQRWLNRLQNPRSPSGTDAIVWAYRLFLDREPESAQWSRTRSRELESWSEIRRQFTGSAEYRQRIGTRGGPR